jgi:uncharacterized radical SAM superfamily protein
MDRYRKLIITLCFLLSINNFTQSQIVSDSIFCYLIKEDKKSIKNVFSMKLFVHNASNDTVRITDFNRYIPHTSAFSFRKTQERMFYWDLLTLSNNYPKDVVIVTILMPTIKTPKKQIKEKNITVVIAPNNTFISDVYMLFSPFIIYPQGYYKLCLFDKVTGKCIAETVIEKR